MEARRLVVACARGIAPVLQAEIEALGYPVTGAELGAVATTGTLHDAMRLNLHLRTAQRVLWLVDEFRAESPDQLYEHVGRLPLEEYLRPDVPFAVTAVTFTRAVRDARFAGLRCKDAVADRFRRRCGRRPDSGPDRSGAGLFLHWRDATAALYLDTTGAPLSHRGYRRRNVRAPMRETLAAALVLSSAWRGAGAFVNPMCGSGTLAIEAAWIATRRAPGLARPNFAFMHLRGFDAAAWRDLRDEAARTALSRAPHRFIATDLDPRAVDAARQNAAAAGVGDLVETAVCDFAATEVPPEGGVIFFNPEYGERLGDVEQLKATYRAIGDFLKQRGAGYTGYVFTGNLPLAKEIGLRTRRRIPFFNSKIECRLLEFELYAGTRKPGPAAPGAGN